MTQPINKYDVYCILPDRPLTKITCVQDSTGMSKWFRGLEDGRFTAPCSEEDLKWLLSTLAHVLAEDVTYKKKLVM